MFKDLSDLELKKKFIRPYKLGQSIFYAGNILDPYEITKVRINETKQLHGDELRKVQEESYKEIQEFNRTNSEIAIISAGHGYNDFEINECGKEVTELYLSSGPGVGTHFSMVAKFIKHPWIVRVLGGLVFVAVAAYIGL